MDPLLEQQIKRAKLELYVLLIRKGARDCTDNETELACRLRQDCAIQEVLDKYHVHDKH